MHKGSYVFSQVLSIIPRYEFDKIIRKHQGDKRYRSLKSWRQFLYMMFGQLTYRHSIKDIVNCLGSHQKALYHLGIGKLVSDTTLTRANKNRDWKIWADLASYLTSVARPMYVDDNDFAVDLDGTAYALDSTVIDICLGHYEWAKFRKKTAAIKVHTLIDLKGDIPVFVHVSKGLVYDSNFLYQIIFEPGAYYVMDMGYYDFSRLYHINECKAFFITRAKRTLSFTCMKSHPVDKSSGLRCDQLIRFTTPRSYKKYPEKVRRIKYYDKETTVTYVFLTNNFVLPALTIAQLYKERWSIELFFKWLKQHLKIKRFWGHSPNAVKTQIWISICTYLVVAILKKRTNSTKTLYEILQILNVSAFSKMPVNQLLSGINQKKASTPTCNQLTLFDL